MERLQKKCFFASTAMHLLLLLLLVVSPAFVAPERKLEDLPILTVIPSRLVDDPFSGGGTPNPAPPPQKVEPEPPKPAPPQKELVEPKPAPEPVKPEPKKPVEAKVPEKPKPAKKETPEPPKPKRKIVPSFKPSSDASAKRDQEKREQERKERQEAARRIAAERNRIVQNAMSSLSTSTHIEQVGPGGAPFANYAQVVKSIYERAWDPPAELEDNLATVKVEVVIARSGKVVSAVIKKHSGNTTLDRSIERVLQIREIRPFPEGTRDLQRTFIIDFNLKAKRFSG